MYSNAELEAIHGGIPKWTQVDELITMLEKTDIPFTVTPNHGRPQVWYPDDKHPICDAICHWGSYGHQTGLIEIMGLTHNDDSVEGYLNADEVFAHQRTLGGKQVKRTCGDCGFYKEKLCGVAIQSGFPESHAACESFSTIAWKCEICGQPVPSPQNLIWDATTKQLVCPNCYMTLPIVSEEEQNDN